jgi:hypothetical protein
MDGMTQRGERTMKRTRRTRWTILLGVVIAVAVSAVAAPTSRLGSHRPAGPPAPSHKTSSLTAALMPLAGNPSTTIHQLTAAGVQPTCAPPPVPAPTYPPGNSYGVPFLAAVSGGELLSGYDEWTANNTTYTFGGHTYSLYPWQSKIFDITGWVTGLLQLPTLSAQIPPQDVVFCDQGGLACVSAAPPAGQCVHINLGAAPLPGVTAPPPPITNVPAPGQTCQNTPSCLSYVVTLKPTGNTTLTVTGVQPNGALNLSVTTAAITSVSLSIGTSTQTCTNAPTSVTLSTQVPSGLPAQAPTAPTAGNPDYRPQQTPPAPLTGPFLSATSTTTSNDFSVPAFLPSRTCPAGGIAVSLNTVAGGWNALSPNNLTGTPNYYNLPPNSPIAGFPGWNQFTVATNVASLGIPVGPPPGFGF